MAVVSLQFPASAEHVRTARLVAVATARRYGIAEHRLDEVRLAVGEVCARAVRRCLGAGTDPAPGLIRMEIEDRGETIEVRVVDQAPEPPAPVDLRQAGSDQEEAIALALVRGLADQVLVAPAPGPGSDSGAGLVVMTWDLS